MEIKNGALARMSVPTDGAMALMNFPSLTGMLSGNE
jgi:hypothetical protein